MSHIYMTNAVAIVADRNKIFYFPVFSISINMVDYEDSLIYKPAIIAFLFVCLPGILLIRTGLLSCYGILIPIFYLTYARTKSSSRCVFYDSGRRYFKFFSTLFAGSGETLPIAFAGTQAAAKRLFNSVMLFGNKFQVAIFAFVFNRRLFSINPSTNISTCDISMSVTSFNNERMIAYRTQFFSNFHEEIIA